MDVTVPYGTEALGHSLVALSDHAFERYAAWLGVATPPGRCSNGARALWSHARTSMNRPGLLVALLLCSHARDARAAPPIALEPADDAAVDTKRPHFTWTLPAGADGAIVEISRNFFFDGLEDTIVGRDAGDATHDLPSVPLYYRVVATTHGVRGESSKLRAFDVHVPMTIHGKHVDVAVPYDAEPLGKKLLALSDHAFERYATWLGTTTSERCSIELLLPSAYAHESKKGVSFHSTSGFTRTRLDGSSSSYVLFERGSARTSEELPGLLDGVTLHELQHCVMHAARQSVTALPSWVEEGAAELFAERALAEQFALPRRRLPGPSSRIRKARQLSKGQWMPLDALFEIGNFSLVLSNSDRASVIYAESASLFHFLDTSPRYHDRFASFLRILAGVHEVFAAGRLRESFEATVGKLGEVETEFLAALPKEAVFPFSVELGEIYPYGPAGVVVDNDMVGQASRVTATGDLEQAHAGDTLAFELTPRAGDGKQVQLVFGQHELSFYRVWLKEGAVPTANVLEVPSSGPPPPRLPTPVPIASRPVPVGALSAGARTKLRLRLEPTAIEVTLDGRSILRCALPAGATTGGWGMGTASGPVHFTTAERIPAP